jgi:Asp-tRNA(Asn)/Glu-tRNA(Gln) amidotransferase A subunit family amidase
VAADRLREHGFQIVQRPALANIKAINDIHMRLITAEMARVHDEWFSDHGNLYGPKTVEMIRQGQSVTDEELRKLVAQQSGIKQQLTAEMDENGIDFLLMPAATDHAPRGLGSTGDPIMNLPWTCAGMPAVSMPGGFDSDGLPQGLQFVARYGEDERLVRLAELLPETIVDISN